MIVPGDGTSVWVCTHRDDFAKAFVPLLGNPQAVGQAFHITSDERLTWDGHYRAVASLLGVEPRLVHVPSDLLAAWHEPWVGGLLGDKSQTVWFDNSKVKRYAPGFAATISYHEGVQRSIAWRRAEASRMAVDDEFNALCDQILEAYRGAWPGGKASF